MIGLAHLDAVTRAVAGVLAVSSLLVIAAVCARWSGVGP